jgi:hypothetical protein
MWGDGRGDIRRASGQRESGGSRGHEGAVGLVGGTRVSARAAENYAAGVGRDRYGAVFGSGVSHLLRRLRIVG